LRVEILSQKPLQLPSTWSCMQNLTTSLKLIETDKSCLTIMLRWTPERSTTYWKHTHVP
jgi:hypothetical protein